MGGDDSITYDEFKNTYARIEDYEKEKARLAEIKAKFEAEERDSARTQRAAFLSATKATPNASSKYIQYFLI